MEEVLTPLALGGKVPIDGSRPLIEVRAPVLGIGVQVEVGRAVTKGIGLGLSPAGGRAGAGVACWVGAGFDTGFTTFFAIFGADA